MTDFGMDCGALEEFGGRLARMVRGLDGTRRLVESYDPDYGHDGVRDAMHHFEDHWRDGREHVKATAVALSSMAIESVQAFKTLDDDIARQMRAAYAPKKPQQGPGNQGQGQQ